MWYLNYCSPFLYDTGGSIQLIRSVLYSTLAVQLLVYIFLIARYKISGEQISIRAQINQGKKEQEELHVKKKSKSFKGMWERQYRLDQKQFKEWYLHYFGLNAVAVGGCIMYSPYPATLVFALLQTFCFLIACAMHSCLLTGTTKYVYNGLMIAMVVFDIFLLFSISMGVGASGYDSGSKSCYLLE